MGTISSNLCKQFITVTVFLLLFSSLGFSQFFIDQDKIDNAKNSKSSFYVQPELFIKNRVQLINYNLERGVYSPIKIGFNKEEYKQEDTVIATLFYAPEFSWDKELHITICPNFNILESDCEVIKSNDLYITIIKPGQKLTITFVFKLNPNPNLEGSEFYLSISSGITFFEHRTYFFYYGKTRNTDSQPLQIAPQPMMQKFIPDTSSKYYSCNSNGTEIINKNDYNFITSENQINLNLPIEKSLTPPISVSVHGVIYFQNLDAGSLSPLNHWLLQVYESDL